MSLGCLHAASYGLNHCSVSNRTKGWSHCLPATRLSWACVGEGREFECRKSSQYHCATRMLSTRLTLLESLCQCRPQILFSITRFLVFRPNGSVSTLIFSLTPSVSSVLCHSLRATPLNATACLLRATGTRPSFSWCEWLTLVQLSLAALTLLSTTFSSCW